MGMWKRQLKARVSRVYGLQARYLKTRCLAVLAYHGVANESCQDQVGRALFAEQMAYLAETWRVAPLDEALSWLRCGRGEEHEGRKTVAITFDDGYRNLLPHALPALETHRLPATVFAIPGLAGRQPWWPANAPASERWLLSKGEIRELAQSGLAIGSHTWTHLDLSVISSSRVTEELRRSKESLEDLLGMPVGYIAYPFGRYNSTVMTLAHEVGYQEAFCSRWGRIRASTQPHSSFRLSRILIEPEDSLEDFKLKLEGGYDWLRFKDSWN